MRSAKLLTIALCSLTASAVYAAEFGDYCTVSLSGEKLNKTDCSVNTMFEGKTYCFGNENAKSAFLIHPAETIAKATAFYAKNAEPEREKISQADALKQIQSKDCDLSNKDAGYLELDGMDLRHCNMVNTSFFGAYLRGANLSGAKLQRAYLNLARLENTDLSGADLTDAIIFAAIFDKTNFKGANLTHARIIGTLGAIDMREATVKSGRLGLDIGNQPMGRMNFDSIGGKFAGSNFENADISRSTLSFADFSNANLRNANLFRAELSQADFTGADLTGADLSEAVIDGAIFKDAKGLDTVKGIASATGKCRECAGLATNAGM